MESATLVIIPAVDLLRYTFEIPARNNEKNEEIHLRLFSFPVLMRWLEFHLLYFRARTYACRLRSSYFRALTLFVTLETNNNAGDLTMLQMPAIS